MKTSFFLSLAFAVCFSITGCKTTVADNTLTKEESETGWKLLFNGSDTEGWRGYKSKDMPTAWKVLDGTLMTTGAGDDIIGDIITVDTYENFDLKLEWKLSPEGNSGILYHIVEKPELDATYYSGPEYQIIDDIGFPGGVTPLNSTGADYAMTPADIAQKVLHPIGEWNHSRIVFDHGKVSHYLNGKKIVEFTAWNPEWYAKVAQSKWKSYPAYGKSKTGYIGLQDHGSKIWYKNIKIKAL